MADTINQAGAVPVQEGIAGGNEGNQNGAEAANRAAEPDVTTQQTVGTQPVQAGVRPEDVQGLVTRESRKAVEKLLRDAGIQPGENPEMQLKDYRKWLDSQKTELERAQGDVRTVTAERDEARAELATAKNTLAAIEKGVPADKAARYIKLAETYMVDGRDLNAALDVAMTDFPLSKQEEPEKHRDIPNVTVPAKREDGDNQV